MIAPETTCGHVVPLRVTRGEDKYTVYRCDRDSNVCLGACAVFAAERHEADVGVPLPLLMALED